MDKRICDRNFILQCIKNAQEGSDNFAKYLKTPEDPEDSDGRDSITLYYYNDGNEDSISGIDSPRIHYQDSDTLSTRSLHSNNETDLSFSDMDTEEMLTTASAEDSIFIMGGDSLQKSFLQLHGISVVSYNMVCNFHISIAMMIMTQYKLHMLAIQEHTPWNRELTDGEIAAILRHCDKWWFTAIVSKLQILIIDKQLEACHRETTIVKEGRILNSRMEIAQNQFVNNSNSIKTSDINH
jgi:hypothetical protein